MLIYSPAVTRSFSEKLEGNQAFMAANQIISAYCLRETE